MYNYQSNNPIKCTLPTTDKPCNTWYDKKELIGGFIGLAIINKKIVDTVTIKLFMGRSSGSSTVYCNLWINNKDENGNLIYCNGHGQAGGYGYHKQSAAIQDALNNAGIVMDECISGVGNDAIRRAIAGIMKAQGHKNILIKEF